MRRPVARLLAYVVQDGLVGTRGQPGALLAHEADLGRQRHAHADQALDRLAEDEKSFSGFKATKEHDLLDRRPPAPPRFSAFHQMRERTEIDHVGLDIGAIAGQAIALAAHPPQQVGASADHHVGQFDRAPLGVDLGQIVQPLQGMGAVEPVPHPGRRGLDHEQGLVERQSLPFRQQAQIGGPAPLGAVHDIGGMVAQVAEHVVGRAQPAIGIGRDIVACRVVGNGHEADASRRIEGDPVLQGLGFDVLSSQVQDRRFQT